MQIDSMARGRFIALEGGDAVGKSTQQDQLVDYLRQQGREVLVTREPGGTPVGEEIRSLLKGNDTIDAEAEALLVFASRRQHQVRIIEPALAQGTWVICDRYTASTYAYQGGGRGMDLDRIRVLDEWMHQGLSTPDLYLVLTLDPDERQRRQRQRSAAGNTAQCQFEDRDRRYHERVNAVYQWLAREYPAQYALMDASLEPDALTHAIQETLEQRGLITATAGRESA